MHETSDGRSFPAALDQVDAAWLTDALRHGGAITADDTVSSFEAIPLGEGYGMLGNLARLILTYEAGAGPVGSVIFKCATASEGNRAVAAAFDMFNREFTFYRTLAEQVRPLIPTCWFSAYDPATLDCSLVMEDLSDYRRGDQAAGCDVDDARICLDRMAVLHSTWFDRTGDPAVAWVPTVDGDMYKIGMVAATQAGWDTCMSIFGSVVPAEISSAKDRYIGALPSLHDRMGSGHQAVLHGDFRLDNLLFGQQPDHRPVVLVDWQGIIRSKPTQDLAYFLTQNVTTEVRRAHETELVERYHRGLVERGVAGYGLDECWEDYRLAALWLWEYGVVIGGTLDPANERGVAFMSSLLERASAAITDHDLLSLIA